MIYTFMTFMTTVYMYTLYKLVYPEIPKPPTSHVHGELCGCFMLFQHPQKFRPFGRPTFSKESKLLALSLP